MLAGRWRNWKVFSFTSCKNNLSLSRDSFYPLTCCGKKFCSITLRNENQQWGRKTLLGLDKLLNDLFMFWNPVICQCMDPISYLKTILLNGVDPLTHITEVAIHCGYDIDKLSWSQHSTAPCLRVTTNYRAQSPVSTLPPNTEQWGKALLKFLGHSFQ